MRAASMHYQLSAGGLRGRELGKTGETRERPGSGPDPAPLSAGRRVVVVRCEGINISGNFYRNKRELGENAAFWGKIPGLGRNPGVLGRIPAFPGVGEVAGSFQKLPGSRCTPEPLKLN